MRDLVIGVTVVLPDGLRASSGGKVVKNVAGYDLGKLFSGSRGRLGLVARVALRLHPLPAAAATVAPTATAGSELHDSYLVPSAVDLANGRTYVLFEGAAASVDRAGRDARRRGGRPVGRAARAAGRAARPRALGRQPGAARPARARGVAYSGRAASSRGPRSPSGCVET